MFLFLMYHLIEENCKNICACVGFCFIIHITTQSISQVKNRVAAMLQIATIPKAIIKPH